MQFKDKQVQVAITKGGYVDEVYLFEHAFNQKDKQELVAVNKKLGSMRKYWEDITPKCERLWLCQTSIPVVSDAYEAVL
ncbi:hypothetical protein MAR_035789 [Mya arenaria]|uniref:Uncharacterized protein n=1 Tax=Mya arenaria TaxID=6604 RepID=A0ABY7EL58_MYAAR|nr:hypothetical protein MAR_035789 [Mya arenaria]